MCYLTFTLLSLTSYALYLLLLTIRQFAFGFTLDINKKNYTKLSVVLSGCFEGCEFPPFFSFSVFLLLLGRKPVVQIFSTNYARFFCLFLWLCIMYCVAVGNIARVYPWIVQGLTFYQHQYKNKVLACIVQVDTFIISL